MQDRPTPQARGISEHVNLIRWLGRLALPTERVLQLHHLRGNGDGQADGLAALGAAGIHATSVLQRFPTKEIASSLVLCIASLVYRMRINISHDS